jgi:putative heme iron utilization protein
MGNFTAVLAAYQALPSQLKSLILATVNPDGSPQASYAPYVIDSDRRFYIFASSLSAHTGNLLGTGQASVLLIQDEGQSPQVFARQRLTYDCQVTLVERHTELWETIAQGFEDRFGEVVIMLRSLPDFQLLCLTPLGGRFILGFGAAYEVDSQDLSQLRPDTVKG